MNEVNHEQIILELLNDNGISVFSPQVVNLISNSELIALACWKNFFVDRSEYEDYSFDKWYKNGNWSHTLNAYKNNITFWKKALALESNLDEDKEFKNFYVGYEILFNEKFVKDFPEVVDFFINNNDELKKLFFLTKDEVFLNCMTVAESEKNILIKELLSENTFLIKEYHIERYQNDSEFMKKIIPIKSSIYENLNDKNKQNDEYITLALIHLNTFKHLPENKKEENFSIWLENNKLKLKHEDIFYLSLAQQESLFFERPDLLNNLLERDFNSYKHIAKKMLEQDIAKNMNVFTLPTMTKLSTLFRDESLNKIKDYLEDFVNKYNKIGKSTISTKKLLPYMPKELNEKLNKNIYYKIGYIKEFSTKGSLSKEQFYYYFETIHELNKKEEVSEEDADALLNELKTLLPNEILKQERLPNKGIFNILSLKKLNQDLNKNLLIGEEKSKFKL